MSESRPRVTESRATSETIHNFSLMSVRIKSTRNSETWWMWRTNPSFFRTKFKQTQWNPWQFSEIRSRIFIIERFSSAIQAWVHYLKQQTQTRSQWDELRRRKKESKDSEPVQEKKKKITVQIPSSSQEISETESRFKVPEGFDSNLQIEHR